MKKILKFSVMILSFVYAFSFAALAYAPQSSFSCEINEKNIPEGTKYVDMLLPVDTDDEAYIKFNSKNGEKYGINENSEIVRYCEDGYRSYTFHVKDSGSQLSPKLNYHYYLQENDYEKCSGIINKLQPDSCYKDEYGYYSVTGEFYLENNKKILLEEIDLNLKSQDNENKFYTEYCKFESEINEIHDADGKTTTVETIVYEDLTYDFEYCCENFQKAKMAYVDAKGNILAVSNGADIYKIVLGSLEVKLSLDGPDFKSELSSGGPSFWILGVFGFGVIFLIGIGVPLMIIFLLMRKSRMEGMVVENGVMCNEIFYEQHLCDKSNYKRGRRLGFVTTGSGRKLNLYAVKGLNDCICVEDEDVNLLYKRK